MVEAAPETVAETVDPKGHVLVLRLYQPDDRCFGPPTAIGRYAEAVDGTILPCTKKEVCYVRTDGVVAYNGEDCVPDDRFLANWDKRAYTELGPCEVPRNVHAKIQDCPMASCTFARDVLLDPLKGCATKIKSIGCRGTEFGKPVKCWCSPSSPLVFVSGDPSSKVSPGGDYAPCDASATSCEKALAIVDTAPACTPVTPADAGTDGVAHADAHADAKVDTKTDVVGESSVDAPLDGSDGG
ncbi:MAG: hypothetical protein NVSMB1_25500 [Polyangiales bacterium]